MQQLKYKIMDSSSPRSEAAKSLSNDVQTLQDQLKEQHSIIASYELKLKNLYEDFNYNLQLIYDRDKEIETLNNKIDELIAANREKDVELISMRSVYNKVRQLEQDKIILCKRIDALLSSNNYPKPVTRKANTPKPEDVNMSIEYRAPIHKKFLSVDRSTKIISSAVPLSQLNMDLEKRIKALEQENEAKNDRMSFKSYTNDIGQDLEEESIEKVISKEKEISDLIKSLSPYKREIGRGKKMSPYENGSGVVKDVAKVRAEPVRPSSKIFQTDPDEFTHEPIVRAGLKLDRKFENRNN
jgi:ATP-dependent Clp protease ATP-binding subunit ClpA